MSCDLLKGKVILLTGGGRGIGRECALAASLEGARVVIADLDKHAAERTAGELPVQGLGVQCDLGDGAAVESAIRRTVDEFGKLDAIHNNAGVSSPSKPLRRTVDEFGKLDAIHNNAGVSSPSKPLHETTEAEWDLLHRVNLKSVYWTTK
jgi:meso-butanediol dehydrogenase/(S,S)-butanediol dehydrogenase/diacetyl reductase